MEEPKSAVDKNPDIGNSIVITGRLCTPEPSNLSCQQSTTSILLSHDSQNQFRGSLFILKTEGSPHV